MASFIYILISIVTLTMGLQLEGQTGDKARVSKFTSKPTAPTPAPGSVSTYRINATNGATCILMRTDALLTIDYRNTNNEDVQVHFYIPDNPELSGDCTDPESESLTIVHNGFTLSMYFKKTPGGERWYASDVELSYSTSNSLFERIDRPNLDVKLSTPSRNTLLFPTPVGKSYLCPDEEVVTMFAQDKSDKSGHLGKLYLRELRMQSFMYKAANTWGPPFQCTATGTYRDETAPVAVGSTLAVAVLATITGYGAWRYFKIKKVQYGTVE